MAFSESKLKRVKQALKKAKKNARACAKATGDVSSSLQELISQRSDSATAFLEKSERNQQEADKAIDSAKADQQSVLEAFAQLQEGHVQSATAFSEAMDRTSAAVRSGSENRRRYLDELMARLRDYEETAEERRDEILARLGRQDNALQLCMPPTNAADGAFAAATDHAETITQAQTARTAEDRRVRAARANREACRALQKGNLTAAVRLLETGRELQAAPELLFNLALAHYLSDDPARSRETLAEANAAGISAKKAAVLTALIALKDRDYESATAAVEQTLGAGATEPFAHAVIATSLLAHGRAASALQSLHHIYCHSPPTAPFRGFHSLLADMHSTPDGPADFGETSERSSNDISVGKT